MTIGDRSERKNYSFTSCVDCGPRYSIIRQTPYDRKFTTMDEFPLCAKCLQEYENPSNRRFHAQSTCCKDCGPKYVLLDRDRNVIESSDEMVIHKSRQLLQNGKILAIKGISGTHLACRADNEDIIHRIRKAKGDRKRKPFALMSYSIEDIEKYALIDNERIKNLLLSPKRPIVLLKKKKNFCLALNVAPDLHNVGVMLPYSGFHYQLLQDPTLRTLIMTSANKSHSPIEIYNEEIFSNLIDIADYFVIHNREIYQRLDDSVIKPILSKSNENYSELFIRRSRGYVPEPISFPLYLHKELLLGLGSELYTAPALLTNGKLFYAQFTGDLKYENNFRFYKSTLNHFQNLLGLKHIKAVAHDLHPLYLSTDYANDLKKDKNIETLSIQHHYAHAASLLVDNELWNEDAIIVTADGLGLGMDNAIWGGEILLTNFTDFQRLDHLKYVFQPGGDQATKNPQRMLISYLHSNSWSEQEIKEKFPNIDSKLINYVIKQIENDINSFKTSSTGRFLDTCSTVLEFSLIASYEGEPAIILESMGIEGFIEGTNPLIDFANKNDLGLNVVPIIPQLLDLKSSGFSINRIAYHVQDFLGWMYAKKVSEYSDNYGINNIGFTGGVAYNELIIESFFRNLRRENKKLNILKHKRISPGDSGISGGQVAILANKLNNS